MKTSGITRRIDELGRIVIPKEIRKTMHIKSGEMMEIFLSADETISLKKYSVIDKKDQFIQQYVEILSKKLKCNIFLTNLSEIIFSNDPKALNQTLSADMERVIEKGITMNNLSSIKIAKNVVLSGNIRMFTLSPNGDTLGVLIFEMKQEINDEDNNLIKFSTAFLENFLENN